ncbi:PaaI family thioesterase [Candidatus Phycosocius spiralis]|uniref:PaaI family thioesterase n=1 Tax=Candidatus Phycosocius spiralis TaxID=2815099 RepID=UPI0024E0F4BD|nr:PaaI family thioesterase [Candidatus Phycosocius spiralis]
MDQAAGLVRLKIVGQAAWCNPRGTLQGGIVTAMLDEAMAFAGMIAGQFAYGVPTLELKTGSLRPCPLGPVEAHGRVVKWGGKAAFF